MVHETPAPRRRLWDDPRGSGLTHPDPRALARAAESQGVAAMAASWLRDESRGRSPLRGDASTECLLVIAAQLGALHDTRELAAERALPPSAAVLWIATALQRAGDHAGADEALRRAMAPLADDDPARRWLDHRRTHPLEPAPFRDAPDEVTALRARLGARMDARETLRGLTLRGIAVQVPTGPREAARWLRATPATTAVALWLVAAFALTAWRGDFTARGLESLGALTIPFGNVRASWRLVSYAWLHAGPSHLALNLASLLVFGRWVERRLGAARMLAMFVASAVAAGISTALSHDGPAVLVGASGALFGMIGAIVAQIAVDRRLRDTPEGRGELAWLLALVLLQAVGDSTAGAGDATTHLAGMLCGAGLGAFHQGAFGAARFNRRASSGGRSSSTATSP